MKYLIREIKPEEYNILADFIYEAIFIPEGVAKPPRSIIENEDLQVYFKNFGQEKDDNALVIEVDRKIIGLCLTRIMKDYGHIDDETPSFAIALYENYRGYGFGIKLMEAMLNLLKEKKYLQASLAVQKDNYALKMYEKLGFEIIAENNEEYIMLYRFDNE